MRKLSRNEKIAAAVGVILVFGFLPMYSSLFSSVSNDSGLLPGTSEHVVNNLQEALADVQVEDFVIGDGPEARQGDLLFVHYVGQLEDGTTFDTSVDNDDPFVLALGSGQVITGWELGLEGMREGGTRRLVIPPALGYGDSEIVGSDGAVLVPSNSTLVFDVVLLKVESPFDE